VSSIKGGEVVGRKKKSEKEPEGGRKRAGPVPS
jgi:hypothetical protein